MASKTSTTTKAKETKAKATRPKKPLPPKEEAKLQAVKKAFPDSKIAVNYARKVLKVEAGLRTTPAPRYTLTGEQVTKIRELIGVPAKPKGRPSKGEAASK